MTFPNKDFRSLLKLAPVMHTPVEVRKAGLVGDRPTFATPLHFFQADTGQEKEENALIASDFS